MAENNEQNQTMNLGELTTIRNILMGQQINEFNQRFKTLEEKLAASEAQWQEKFNALEAKHREDLDSLQRAMTERFDKLENLLMDNVTKINERMDRTSLEDKHQLGELLGQISQKLLNS
ncbi:MAG: hypothetical protein D6714_20610 [Bacteroidetes bacterium]|nr:MAG: hypothetical protein D6714_20610 [Bacteroidota bacterium]